MSTIGIRVGGASKPAGMDQHAKGSKGRDMGVASAADSGVFLACKNSSTKGTVVYKFVLEDGGSSGEFTTSQGRILKGNDLSSGSEKYPHLNKAEYGDEADERTTSQTVVLNLSHPHCRVSNGHEVDKQMHLEAMANGRQVPPEEKYPHSSSYIPVPRRRKPSGHADKEVMAATVLTSLSTSPLVLTQTASAAVPELASKGWKDTLSTSYSSSTSGNWSWDTSDQSVPSTPSPPLSNDANKSYLLSSQCDDAIEDGSGSTHFLFEDPIPRKRKNSMKVMFKCLWKNCEKVLSTSSGIQRHIRTFHLGRNCESDYSDGEEDFYYSEIQVNMDSLSEGLSSLTPTSPTTAGPPPIFPVSQAAFVHRSEPSHIIFSGQPGRAPTLLSQSAPSTLCHIRTDHAYQATDSGSIPMCMEQADRIEGMGNSQGISGPSPADIMKGFLGPLTQIRTVSFGEKKQSGSSTNTAIVKTSTPAAPLPKPAPGTRKPRGEAKKCRKVYGMEKRDMWCTACRWKKACQRFTD
ncbi:hypothetical protein DPEC_G00003350 [Dallia pectoralis]|uniref:Uncharacterized protein n=1 Tax=Dallia pectoralis TaxID=75939 RepID=A0ACC2HJR0_DALPE|nr:hypothetical protein DPEC_G00003350 [Dallia pectoralis]